MRTLFRIGAIAGALAAAAAAVTYAAPAAALVWPDVPERIERGLASTDPVTRRVAARELTTLSANRAEALVLRALQDADVDVRLAAAQSAVRLHVVAATEVVLPWLGASSAPLRVAACEVARAMPDARAVPQLGRALGDGDAQVRAAAADALGAYAGSEAAVPPLLGKLDDASPAVRIAIARSLAKLADPRAVVPLVGKVQDSVPEVRQAIARALGELGDLRATQALLLQLRDNSSDVRVEALGAIGRLRAPDAVDAIAPLTTDRNGALRQAALRALGRIGTPAAVHALIATLGYADDAGGGLERTPVRDALVLAGTTLDLAPRSEKSDKNDRAASPRAERVATDLAAVLERPSSPAAATSAAWILGELHARAHAPAIVQSMRRGTLPSASALRGLAGAGTSESVPVVLEFTSDPNPLVRDEAQRAAAALLDPGHPDGRAVEPLAAALRDARLSSTERATVARLLGRTGAGRAGPVLAGLASTKDVAVRLAAIDALGMLGPAGTERTRDLDPLLVAVADPDPNARLHAAVALGEAGDARARDLLLAKLDGGDEVDRSAIFVALGGILPRAPSDAAVARLSHDLDLAAGADRDAILGALGRAPLASARAILGAMAASPDADDRRTAATLYAAQPGSHASARTLLGDPDASVRAQAAWSLGTIGDLASIPSLVAHLHDETDVAIDAAAAIGRIAARARSPQAAAQSLCPLLASASPAYVRANALAGLALAGARCGDGAVERHILETDPADLVRAAAALTLTRAPLGEPDRRAIDRCATTDRVGAIAARCRTPSPLPTRVHAVDVYIVPDLTSTPRPRAAYVLDLADGLLRAGSADRRGAVLDPAAPEGQVSLRRSAR